MTKPRVVLITGATGKVGQELVTYFLSLGDIVLALARSKSGLNSLEESSQFLPGRLISYSVDLLSPDIRL